MFNLKNLFKMSDEKKTTEKSELSVTEWLEQQNIDVVCHPTSAEIKYAEKYIEETNSDAKPENVLKQIIAVRKRMISQPVAKK